MKSVSLYILAGMMALAMVSCAGTPPQAADERASETPGDAGTASAPVEKNVMIQKVAGETVMSPDGTVDKEVEYSYNESGRLADIVEHDGRGELLSERRFSYSDGALTRKEESDVYGLVSVTLYENNSSSQIVREEKQDAKGTSLSVVTYEYADGRLAKSVASDGEGVPQLSAEYDYQGDVLVTVRYLLPGGKEDARFIRTVENGVLVEEKTILPDGSVESGRRFEYSDGILVSEELFSGTSVTRSVRYDYDADGNIIRETWSNRNGRDFEVVERRWITVEVKE